MAIANPSSLPCQPSIRAVRGSKWVCPVPQALLTLGLQLLGSSVSPPCQVHTSGLLPLSDKAQEMLAESKHALKTLPLMPCTPALPPYAFLLPPPRHPSTSSFSSVGSILYWLSINYSIQFWSKHHPHPPHSFCH